MASILITGGAGFIGSNFVRMMVKQTQYDIVVVDKLTYAGNLQSIEDVFCERCRFVHADIADGVAMEALFERERFDNVINFEMELLENEDARLILEEFGEKNDF